ncbi:MAG: SRPBCC domain-containing protein [Planctomycetes bacterium]|nr:SRPBCC domain-containing protein [Planctomycetota bacterium]MCB9871700.1 SRPBCC domain-containing protein [Planctomycetota bacterium]
MTQRDPTREYRTELDIDAPRDAVWQAISTAAELRRWFAPIAQTDQAPGGSIVWEWPGHHRWEQTIEVLEPGTRLKTRYDSAAPDGRGGKLPLFIDFVLEGEGGSTTLRLVQSGFGPGAEFDQEYDGISRGWPVELRSLRLYLERHRGVDRQLAWSTFDLDWDPSEAWARLTGPEGLGVGANVQSCREGEPFRFVTGDGDVLAGHALRCHPREFSADLESHGHAFFRMSAERWGGLTHVWIWLGAYRQDAAALAALQQRWDAMLQRLFGGAQHAATGGMA